MVMKIVLLSSFVILSHFASSAAVESDDVVKEKDVRADTYGTNCGRSKYSDAGAMIVGGKTARPNEFPWQISLRRYGQHVCGGSIIGSQWILTAAHCMFDSNHQLVNAGILTVAVGEHQRSAVSSIRQIIGVRNFSVHQSYSTSTMLNDIALIRLSSAINYTANIAPVCLPGSTTELFVGRTAYVSGWGSTAVGGTGTDILMFTTLIVPTNDYCGGQFPASTGIKIYPSMMCTRDTSGNTQRDSCQGDSGGPVVVKDSASGTFTLAGIVSFGIGCASGYPGVNTRVSSHLSWIYGYIGNPPLISTTKTTTTTTTTIPPIIDGGGGGGGGCFAGSSTVSTRGGQRVHMSDLKVGDEVLTVVDGEAAQLRYAPVIAFLDRDVEKSAEFVEIVTAAAHKLTLTPSHLIYIAPHNSSAAPRMIFAAHATVGDFVFAATDDMEAAETATRDEIVSMRVVTLSEGVYAPLTTSGTIVVDGITCSCYAEFSSHRIAHLAMLPLSVYHYMKSALLASSSDEGSGALAQCNVDHGIHWYAGLLRGVVNNVSFL